MRQYLIPAMIVAAAVAYYFQSSAGGPQLVRYTHVQDARAASSAKPFKILFLGNSHTFVGDIPSRVEALLNENSRIERKAVTGVVSFGGAKLSQIINSGWADKALSVTNWDLVVVQHQSSMALSANSRKNFADAVSWFMRRLDYQSQRLMIYQVWPNGPQQLARYQQFSGYPRTPAHMHRITSRVIRRVAKKHGLTIARVGDCWLGADNNERLYQTDHNHASPLGVQLSARVLATAIANHINRIEGRAPNRVAPCA